MTTQTILTALTDLGSAEMKIEYLISVIPQLIQLDAFDRDDFYRDLEDFGLDPMWTFVIFREMVEDAVENGVSPQSLPRDLDRLFEFNRECIDWQMSDREIYRILEENETALQGPKWQIWEDIKTYLTRVQGLDSIPGTKSDPWSARSTAFLGIRPRPEVTHDTGRPALYIDGDKIDIVFEDGSEQHSIDRWWHMRVSISNKTVSSMSELYRDYAQFCRDQDYFCWPETDFKTHLELADGVIASGSQFNLQLFP